MVVDVIFVPDEHSSFGRSRSVFTVQRSTPHRARALASLVVPAGNVATQHAASRIAAASANARGNVGKRKRAPLMPQTPETGLVEACGPAGLSAAQPVC